MEDDRSLVFKLLFLILSRMDLEQSKFVKNVIYTGKNGTSVKEFKSENVNFLPNFVFHWKSMRFIEKVGNGFILYFVTN